MARAMNLTKRLNRLKAMHRRAAAHASRAHNIALELRNAALRGEAAKRALKLAARASRLAHLLDQVKF
jgi:hypothetical protein